MAEAIRLSSSTSAAGAVVAGKLVGAATDAALGLSGAGELMAASVAAGAGDEKAIDVRPWACGGLGRRGQGADINIASSQAAYFLRISLLSRLPGTAFTTAQLPVIQDRSAPCHCRLQIVNCKLRIAMLDP